MKRLDPTYQVLYSELAQRALDAAFSSEFSIEGRFVSQDSGGRRYWYFDLARAEGPGKHRRYVGPVDDPEITARVAAFKDLKADHRARRKLVSTLVREAYLPRPEAMAGDVVRVLADAGFFRLRGVLVGTVAYQAYGPLLGVRLPQAILQTGDADFAQFHSISSAVDDAVGDVLALLRTVDPTFREVPHPADGRHATAFVARSGYRVEFLTPSTGSSDHDGLPAPMQALGGVSAQPLRFLDYLIHEPVRAVLLHGAGVPVIVPAPERYAVHKLIVAARRRQDGDGTAKSAKDLRQASALIEALVEVRRADDLTEAYAEARGRGPAWREAIRRSLPRLEDATRAQLHDALERGARQLGLPLRALDLGELA
jgi:hypothetical protein